MDLKKMLLILSVGVLLPLSVFGQQNVEKNRRATVESHADTILIKKGDRDLRVKIYEEKKVGETVHSEEIFSGTYVDFLDDGENKFLDVLPFVPQKKRELNFEANFPFFYLAFGRAASGALSYDSRYPQRTGKSVDWGFNLYNSEIRLDRKANWGLTWAVGFAYSRYVFDTPSALEKVDGNMVWTPAPEGVDYQKSWLRYWSFRVPVCIEWQKKIRRQYFYLSAGPEVEIRFAMKSKVKYGGDDHTLTSNPNANVIGANLMVQAGYGWLSFIGRFGFTPLMDKNRSPHLYHSSVGFGIHF